MALGDFQLFTWKNKETQQREHEEYAKCAFPYGEAQRENLEELLLDVYPRESIQSVLVSFLTCKELFEGILKKAGSRDEAADLLINNTKRYKQIIKKTDMPVYTALVLADADIDENCHYPSADEIRARAVALGKPGIIK